MLPRTEPRKDCAIELGAAIEKPARRTRSATARLQENRTILVFISFPSIDFMHPFFNKICDRSKLPGGKCAAARCSDKAFRNYRVKRPATRRHRRELVHRRVSGAPVLWILFIICP